MVEHDQTISEDEAAIYDRQIRLWGVEAQKRLRGARMMIAGLGGLGAEVCKNMALAGVKSVTLLDHQMVTPADLHSQFFVSQEDLGKNRAVSSLLRIQQLNPMVSVTAQTGSVDDKSDEFFHQFDVICLIGCKVSTMTRINNICRSHDIKFFAGDVIGFFGFMFSDLGDHEFVEEVIQYLPNSIMNDGRGSMPSNTKHDVQITKLVKNNVKFVPLEDVLNLDWTTDKIKASKRELTRSYFILHVYQKFHEEKGCKPNIESQDDDVHSLIALRDQLTQEMGMKVDKIGDDFAKFCFAEVSPVCAIVGGILAQEIVKAISHKDSPINNFFFYDGFTGDGVVEFVGP